MVFVWYQVYTDVFFVHQPGLFLLLRETELDVVECLGLDLRLGFFGLDGLRQFSVVLNIVSQNSHFLVSVFGEVKLKSTAVSQLFEVVFQRLPGYSDMRCRFIQGDFLHLPLYLMSLMIESPPLPARVYHLVDGSLLRSFLTLLHRVSERLIGDSYFLDKKRKGICMNAKNTIDENCFQGEPEFLFDEVASKNKILVDTVQIKYLGLQRNELPVDEIPQHLAQVDILALAQLNIQLQIFLFVCLLVCQYLHQDSTALQALHSYNIDYQSSLHASQHSAVKLCFCLGSYGYMIDFSPVGAGQAKSICIQGIISLG